MKETGKEQARRRISFHLRHSHGPRELENTSDLSLLPAGSMVLIYRAKSNQWEGPHMFITCDDETVLVQPRQGRVTLRSTCAQPCVRHIQPDLPARNQPDHNVASHITRQPANSIKKGQTKPTEKVRNAIDFATSRRKEPTGLIENGTF